MGKRTGVKNISTASLKPSSTQKITDEYVMHSAANNQNECKIAVGLSSDEILLFDLTSMAKLLTLKGHKKSVTGMKFSRENPNLILSSSLDGNIFVWDIRQGIQPAQTYFDDTDGPLKPLLCFDFNASERYISAGTELIRQDSFIIFWDQRTAENLGGYWNSHTGDITHLQFHLNSDASLASSSVDGLINVFDLNECTEDDALVNTLNTDTSVNRFSWNLNDQIACITGTEEYQLWSAEETKPYLAMNRQELSENSQCQVDYLIDTFIGKKSFYFATGSNNGNVQLYCDKKSFKFSNILVNGHSDIVRTVCLSQNNCLVTGGEDGQLCTWIVP